MCGIGISWFLIYRQPEYKSLVKNIEGLQKKIDKSKEGTGMIAAPLVSGGSKKTQDRKVQQLETQMKQYN